MAAPNNRTITISDEERKDLIKLLDAQIVNCNQFDIHWDGVDMLFLDPPYDMAKDFGDIKFKKMGHEAYAAYLDAIITHHKPSLKPTASIFVCGDWFSSHSIQTVLEKHFIVRNRLTWQREKGRGSKTNWKAGCEDIWWATVSNDYKFYVDRIKINKKVIAPYKEDGKAKDWNEDTGCRATCPSNFLSIFSVPFWSMPENTPHKTQKPEKLLAMLMLATTDEGNLIIDPFLGSGTTAVVAKKLNRQYAGCDVDQDWCLYTLKRLQMAETDKTIQGYENGIFLERNPNL